MDRPTSVTMSIMQLLSTLLKRMRRWATPRVRAAAT